MPALRALEREARCVACLPAQPGMCWPLAWVMVGDREGIAISVCAGTARQGGGGGQAAVHAGCHRPAQIAGAHRDAWRTSKKRGAPQGGAGCRGGVLSYSRVDRPRHSPASGPLQAQGNWVCRCTLQRPGRTSGAACATCGWQSGAIKCGAARPGLASAPTWLSADWLHPLHRPRRPWTAPHSAVPALSIWSGPVGLPWRQQGCGRSDLGPRTRLRALHSAGRAAQRAGGPGRGG